MFRSQGYLKEDLTPKRPRKLKQDNKVKEILNVDRNFQGKIKIMNDPETLEIRDVITPGNRRRVPVFVYDIHGTLFKKMEINMDKSTDISILYRSFERILKFLDHDYLQSANQQIEAITHEGIHLQDLNNLDFDAVKRFNII